MYSFASPNFVNVRAAVCWWWVVWCVGF